MYDQWQWIDYIVPARWMMLEMIVSVLQFLALFLPRIFSPRWVHLYQHRPTDIHITLLAWSPSSIASPSNFSLSFSWTYLSCPLQVDHNYFLLRLLRFHNPFVYSMRRCNWFWRFLPSVPSFHVALCCGVVICVSLVVACECSWKSQNASCVTLVGLDWAWLKIAQQLYFQIAQQMKLHSDHLCACIAASSPV